MGGTYSYLTENKFYIYSRSLDNDKYKLLFTIDDFSNPLSRFKHEVFAYALKKKHTEEKSLYLYCGYARVAKCIRILKDEVPYIELTFAGGEYADMFDKCREQIPHVNKDMSWLESLFGKSWVFFHHDNPNVRLYQNFKMDSCK